VTIEVGKKVPAFTAESTGGPVSLAALRGSIVVLYFYPKDNTPGCTTEGQDFAAAHAGFRKAGAVVYGVSRDTLKSHAGFKLCDSFGVMKLKNMYGKQVRGIERSTFVIGADGKLARQWRGVRVPQHVDEVLAFVQTLS